MKDLKKNLKEMKDISDGKISDERRATTKIFFEVKEMFSGNPSEHKHWTMDCNGCAEDIMEVIDISFTHGRMFEHLRTCRDKSNCRVCKGEVVL